VGLDHVLNLPMNQNDHYLQTLENFEPSADGEPIDSASALVSRLKIAHDKGWFSSFY
jgi:hypothetical protein